MALGGDLVAGFEEADAFVAVRSVAVLDVAGERPGEGVPVEVVGVVDDELADREEVALDGVEVAGVGGRGHQLDVGGGGEAADVGGPVGREVVLDPVDASVGGDRGADLGHEGEVVAAASAWPEPDPEAVVVDVVGAEDVAGAVGAGGGCALAPGPGAGGPARARPRGQAGPAPPIKRDYT